MRQIVCAILAVTLTIGAASFAQQTATVAGRVTDRTNYVLPGVTVTVTSGDVRRRAVTDSDGQFAVADLPSGTYSVTAELAGFLTETATVEIPLAGSLDFRLRLGCLGEFAPPLTVTLPFAQLTADIDAVVHLRIRETGNRERLLTDDACLSVRPYIAELLEAVNVAPGAFRTAGFRFYAHGWDKGLAPGDEVITFLARDRETGGYHELDDAYRIEVGDGRAQSMLPPGWPAVTIGEPVDGLLTRLRAALGR